MASSQGKGKLEFKPVKLRFKFDPVLNHARAEGSGIYIYILFVCLCV